MTKFRLAATAVMAGFALLLVGGAGTAAAQDPAFALGKKVPIAGTAVNGKKFTGTFTIKKFAQRQGQAVAIGTLRGTLKNRSVTRRGVALPASLTAAEEAPGLLPRAAQRVCPILDLRLGPINLNLLGLRITTNEIHLRIVAESGPGNLLGNLLCAITNLLNPPALSGSPLGQLVQILNALLALAPRTATALPA